MSAAKNTKAAAGRRLSILIADDDRDTVMTLEAILMRGARCAYGYEWRLRYGGCAAVQASRMHTRYTNAGQKTVMG